MVSTQEVVITGLGVVSPIGIGSDSFWKSLVHGHGGVRPLTALANSDLPVKFGGEILDFDPKRYVTPRKSLKVMSREIQLAFASAELACQSARLETGAIDPDRLGVVFGADMIYCDPAELVPAFRSCMVDGKLDFRLWGPRAMPEMYPLWLLKYLPNMPACHIAIARDARGPSNSLTMGEVSFLLAVTEGMRIIERGQADAIIAGGTGSPIQPTRMIWLMDGRLSNRAADPAAASRPFDADRDGIVFGEGAAAVILESRRHAVARGAPALARVLGYGSAFEPRCNGRPTQGTATRAAIRRALQSARLTPTQVGHVNANGLSTIGPRRRRFRKSWAMFQSLPPRASLAILGPAPVEWKWPPAYWLFPAAVSPLP
jgi:3-oxoacyl-[acyl-carrier-protein] synthase II